MDLEGVVALYEPEAVMAFPAGELSVGLENIRRLFEGLLTAKTAFQGDVRPAIRKEDLALTSTKFPGNATVEVARRQEDGSWLWVIDQPSVLK